MNIIEFEGKVFDDAEFSHEVLGENFYKFYISISRISNTADILPCVISEVLVDKVKEDERFAGKGEIRTRNVTDEDGVRHLEVIIFVTDVYEPEGYDYQEAMIEGFLCKLPNYRKTPLGRSICDISVACNRERSRKSDYIPCITWGRNAVRTSGFTIGTHISVLGRMQSREYQKVLEDGSRVTMTTYEFSANAVKELLDEEGE